MEGTTGTTTTTTSTPGSTSSPVSAAPATSAPAATPTPSQRPTFAQAFAADAAAQQTAPATSTEPAATVPVAGQPTSGETKGPIPFDVHHTALQNARTKAEADALAKWRQQYGWAEQMTAGDRDGLQRWAQLADRMSSDPIGHITDLIQELQNHTVYGPQLRSQAGRLLAGARGPQRVDMTPDLEVRNDQGQVVERSFSAPKLLAILDQVVNDKLSPLQQDANQRKAAEQQAQRQTEARAEMQRISTAADSMLEDINGILDIDDPKSSDAMQLYSEVTKVMEQYPTLSGYRAALHVRDSILKPSAAAKAQAAAVDSLKTQAAAQSVKPSGAATPATKRPSSFMDKSLTW
jgi:hypothetical protein